MPALQALLGLLVFHAAVWALSERRAAIPWRLVLTALVVQFVLAAAFVRWPPAGEFMALVNALMGALQRATDAGTQFLFGHLAGAPAPYEVVDPGARFVLAVRALPLIIVVSALSRVLTYWGVLPALVGLAARALRRLFGIGGALAISAAANVFVGMTEAPLLVRPWLAGMSRGELFALMSTGMATIAGTVYVLFAAILAPVVPDAPGHLLAASLMSVPAALAYSLMLVPVADAGSRDGGEPMHDERDEGTFDALTRGTFQGLTLFLNIVAMLLVLVALVHLVNQGLGWIDVAGEPLSLQRVFGFAFAPVCWLMGIPWADAAGAGALMGTKVVLNELIAYVEFAALPAGTFSPAATLVLTYALCGFANFGSLGMLVGALALLAPERRLEILALGLPSIAVGVLATCTTGAIVGLVAA